MTFEVLMLRLSARRGERHEGMGTTPETGAKYARQLACGISKPPSLRTESLRLAE